MFETLQEILKSARPRETSGSRTVGRYDYQAHCGILKLVELYRQVEDFRVVFDYFDDIFVLNSSALPTSAELFQIKTKDSGDWSTANLCAKVGKEAPHSIVARLYDHIQVLGKQVERTSFVSNAAFKVALKDGTTSSGGHHSITGADIHENDLKKIKKAIETDFSPCEMNVFRSRVILVRSPMSVHGQKEYVIGILHQFCAGHEVSDVNLDPFYETLYETIQSCTRFAQDGLTNDEIIEKKSITRGEFAAVIERASHRQTSFLSDWSMIAGEMSAVGMGTVRQLRLKTAAIKHMANRSAGHAVASDLSDAVLDWLDANPNSLTSAESIFGLGKVLAESVANPGLLEDDFVGAMLAEAYEAINEG